MSSETYQKQIHISLFILLLATGFPMFACSYESLSKRCNSPILAGILTRRQMMEKHVVSPGQSCTKAAFFTFKTASKESFIPVSMQPKIENIKLNDNPPKIDSSIFQADSSVDINHLFMQAYKAQAAEDYIKAEAIWRRILQLNTDSQIEALVYNNLGDTLRLKGKLNEAIRAYRDSLEIDPNLFIARISIGTTQYQMGQTEAALSSLNDAKEFLPEKIESLENLHYYRDLSTGLRQIDRFHESVQIIRRAISLNPYIANAENCQLLFEVLKSWEIPINLMWRQYRSARCELRIALPRDRTAREKLEAINKTIRSTAVQKSQYAETYNKVGLAEVIVIQPHTLFQPDYPNDRLHEAYSITHLNLGISLLNRAMLTGDSASMKEAIISYHHSLVYDRNYSWTYLYLSIALISQGRLEQAISIAQQALQLANEEAAYGAPTSTHPWAHNILGYALELQGNSNAALAEYQSSLRLDPAFTSAQNNLQEIR